MSASLTKPTLLKSLLALGGAAFLSQGALAQAGGSTYPAGSNLPQRTAGEIASKPAAPQSGSAGGVSTTHNQSKSGGGKRPPNVKKQKRGTATTSPH